MEAALTKSTMFIEDEFAATGHKKRPSLSDSLFLLALSGISFYPRIL